MLSKYALDETDEKIIDELDNLFGVIQNKEVLRNIIIYSKLRKNNEIAFGNYNIIIRNNSSYEFLDDFLGICAKLFVKNNIILNDKICYLNKNYTSGTFKMPFDIDSSIIVISDKRSFFNYNTELDNIKSLVQKFNDKIFIFVDESFREGEIDAQLSDIAFWRMTINKISLDDKLTYCRNKFNENKMEWQEKELSNFANQPFWKLRNNVMQLIVESKANDQKIITSETLRKKSETSVTSKRVERKKKIKVETAKEDMNNLIGLDAIKSDIDKILNYIKLNKQRGQMPTLHMCFNGNPGTGKTSVARIIGKLFSEEKILPGNGDFVEIHGRDLVAKYVGWTAQKVHDIVESAIGGVLFIDEAYSLVSDGKGGFEGEAIDTLIKEMEDHRHEICIILAGYTNEMNDLLNQNPGFKSRIQFTINFPDYSIEELFNIFTGLCKQEKYVLSKNCKDILLENFEKAKNDDNFGNGRYVRNIFEKIKFEQADRIIKTKSKNLNLINKSDIEKALFLENFNKIKIQKRTIGF